ncbi:MAG TPA: hypothetical protein VG224_06260, partial [Reyranella sp.]|nr:hypothetical protein [Reyranella sp.]
LTELSNVVAYACRHSRAEDRQMATPGQPTLYKPEYCELAHNYCLLGATNEVLGDFFGVTRRTIQNWIATHPTSPKRCAAAEPSPTPAGESMRRVGD